MPYGITSEKSDWRIHINLYHRQAFWFRTAEGAKTAETARQTGYPPGTQVRINGIQTAYGYACSISSIESLCYCALPEDLFKYRALGNIDHSTKGEVAEKIARIMLSRGLMAEISISTQEVGYEDQIKGIDLLGDGVVHGKHAKIQVKCDNWRDKDVQDQFIVFLQTAECNPNNYH